MTSITDVIGHYQRSIEKSAHDEARLLHCIEKLYKLPITVEHLQQTGIGKTVNSLRKYDKEVGVAAKALVAKWKAMVAAEEELVHADNTQKINGHDRSSSDNENYNGSQCSQGSDNDNYSNQKQLSNRNERTNEVDRQEKRHKVNGREDARTHSYHSTSDNKKMESVLSDRHNRDKISSSSTSLKNHREKQSTSEKYHSDHKKNENVKGSSNRSSRKAQTPESSQQSPICSDDNFYENDYDDEDEEKLIIDTELNKEKVEEMSKHSYPDSIKTSKSSSRHKSGSSKKSSSDDNQSSEHQNKKKHKSEGKDRDRKEKKSSSSSKSSDRGDKDKSNHKSSRKDEEKSSQRHNGENKSSSSSKSKHNEKSKEVEKHSSKSDHHKTSKDKGSSSEVGSINKKSSKRKHESAEDSESAEEQASPKKSKSGRRVDVDGIDSSMGSFSFEQALGMIAPAAKVAGSKIKSPKGNGPPAKLSTTVTPSRSGASSSSGSRSKTPPLLTTKVKLEPLDPKLSLELPIISPNYKPLPLNPTVMDCVFANNAPAKPAPPKRLMTDDEALQSGISSKTIRTKIYSGIKTGVMLQVPTLHKLCLRVLQKNIDALEYTGGVPFYVLKPVLELATPEQLQTFEEYNSYLMEDTDDLWRVHCSRRYKSQKRKEMEAWREMYARCKEQEEERLNMLTKNISYQQKQIAAPIKRTQLAYVDVDVKPPRNVLRKQEQYGTKGKLIATPAARVEALSKVTPSAAKIGDTRLRVAADVRDHAQASSYSRPKKAPLMQKTLQLMKGRFKR